MVEGNPGGNESFRRDQKSTHGAKNEARPSSLLVLSPASPSPSSRSLLSPSQVLALGRYRFGCVLHSKSSVLKGACLLLFDTVDQEEAKVADPATDLTEEKIEADLVLTELFTLGVEDDVATDSEDDHSGLALTTSNAAVEVAGGSNADGQENEVQQAPQEAARSAGTHRDISK